MHTLRNIPEAFGRLSIQLVEGTGVLTHMATSVFQQAIRRPFRLRLIMAQMEWVGVKSLVIVGVTGLFCGMVFAVQLYIALSMFGASGLVGASVGISLSRELSPVFCALMVTGRVGSAMAATLGTMRVSEQIDALEAMAVNPIHYLVVPRVIAATLMMPVLVVFFEAVGLIGAYWVSVNILHVDAGMFLSKLWWYVDPDDFWKGMIKGGVFGFIFAVVGCARGYHARGGADGVGRATTQAVVVASVLIFVSDYFLTSVMW